MIGLGSGGIGEGGGQGLEGEGNGEGWREVSSSEDPRPLVWSIGPGASGRCCF